jgi:hypothetical protein
MKDKDKELEELEKQLHKNIEEMYGKEMLEQFKSNVEDKESKDQEVEMLNIKDYICTQMELITKWKT